MKRNGNTAEARDLDAFAHKPGDRIAWTDIYSPGRPRREGMIENMVLSAIAMNPYRYYVELQARDSAGQLHYLNPSDVETP